MKYNKNKILMWSGYTCILISLLCIFLRSHLIEFFEKSVQQNYAVPAGKMFDLDNQNFSFAVISDTGASNKPIDFMLKKIKNSEAKFILHLGDLVRYRNPTHFDWMVSEIEEDSDNFPFYMVPGNHEVAKEDGIVDKSAYLDTFGQTHYWFSYGNTLFVGMDTSEGTLDDEQMLWLKNTLEKIRPQFKYCVIFSHIPPVNPIGGDYKNLEPSEAKKLANAIFDKNINLLLFGHVHGFGKTKFAGIPMYTLPSSGQEIRSEINKYGYVDVKISEKGVASVNVNYVEGRAETEDMESFFSHSMVKKEIKWFSLGGLFLGILLLGIARRFKNKA